MGVEVGKHLECRTHLGPIVAPTHEQVHPCQQQVRLTGVRWTLGRQLQGVDIVGDGFADLAVERRVGPAFLLGEAQPDRTEGVEFWRKMKIEAHADRIGAATPNRHLDPVVLDPINLGPDHPHTMG